jgi:hypothetical protein
MAKMLKHDSWKTLNNKRLFEFQALPVEMAPLPVCRYCAAVFPAAVDWICCPYCAEIITQGQAQPQLKRRKF